ncbi:MAG: pyrimidine dimer DNA glycosylase/endonuclease V [Candidatus Nanoarchaeia archaeon]|jgi:hypothetical protein
MRDWGVDPKLLCKKHLCGSHVELHMALGCLIKNKNISGFTNGLIDFNRLYTRHAEIVHEMESRGYKHNTPLETIPNINIDCAPINTDHNLIELCIRCRDCCERIKKNKK